MIDAAAVLIVDNTKRNNNNLNDVVSMIDSTVNDMEKSDNDLSDVVSTIDSTVDEMEKSNDNLDNVISMIISTVDNTKKNDNDSSNVVLMIGHAEAALTVGDMKKIDNDHNKEPSDYDTVMEDNDEETKHSDDVVSTLDETILLIDTVEKCNTNDDDEYIGTRVTKYVCFNTSTSADIEQHLSLLQHSNIMPVMVGYNGVQATVEIVLAPDHPSAIDDHIPLLHLDLCHWFKSFKIEHFAHH